MFRVGTSITVLMIIRIAGTILYKGLQYKVDTKPTIRTGNLIIMNHIMAADEIMLLMFRYPPSANLKANTLILIMVIPQSLKGMTLNMKGKLLVTFFIIKDIGMLLLMNHLIKIAHSSNSTDNRQFTKLLMIHFLTIISQKEKFQELTI